MWAWRHNLSAYDAAYVALTQVLQANLLTGDAAQAKVTQATLGNRLIHLPSAAKTKT
jgi:predicted nucleic acid-binding protein